MIRNVTILEKFIDFGAYLAAQGPSCSHVGLFLFRVECISQCSDLINGVEDYDYESNTHHEYERIRLDITLSHHIHLAIKLALWLPRNIVWVHWFNHMLVLMVWCKHLNVEITCLLSSGCLLSTLTTQKF